MLNEEVAKYRELSGDTNPNVPISRIGGYLDGYEKALEQEPCEDAISKTDIIELLRHGRTYAFHHPEQYKTEREADIVDTLYVNLIQAVDKLPPVNPQKNIVNNGTMNITL